MRNGSIYAVILAGGSGTRMNTPVPKQFLMLGDTPILVRSVNAFLRDPRIKQVGIGANGDWFDMAREQLNEHFGDDGRLLLCEGGENRESTLINTLTALRAQNDIGDEDVVLIHDAVRPFVSARIINDLIAEMEHCEACNTVIPVNDTIVRSDDGNLVTGMPARHELFAGQSPQGFGFNALWEAFGKVEKENLSSLTETTKVCFMQGMSVHMVKGDFYNFKITTQYDLIVAESILGYVEKAAEQPLGSH